MKVKNKDKVGILIQTFNDGDYLISAVESILISHIKISQYSF